MSVECGRADWRENLRNVVLDRWFSIPGLLVTNAEHDARITDLEEGGGDGSSSNGEILC